MRIEEVLQAMIASPNPRVRIFERTLEDALHQALFPVWKRYLLLEANVLVDGVDIEYIIAMDSMNSICNYTQYCITHELSMVSDISHPVASLIEELRKNPDIPTVSNFENLELFNLLLHQNDLISNLFQNQYNTDPGFPVVETPIQLAAECGKYDSQVLYQARKYRRISKNNRSMYSHILARWFEEEMRSGLIFGNPTIAQHIIPAIVQIQLEHQSRIA